MANVGCILQIVLFLNNFDSYRIISLTEHQTIIEYIRLISYHFAQ